MPKPSNITQLLDQAGVDTICSLILDGNTLADIAAGFGVARSTLHYWIADSAYPERSVRAREARTIAAAAWDEKAEALLRDAKDNFELMKAKELSHHYRWRAKAIAPRDYGDKQADEGKSNTVEHVDVPSVASPKD